MNVYNLERPFGAAAGVVHLAPLQNKALILGNAPTLLKGTFSY